MMKSGVIFLLFSSETLRRLKHLAYPPLDSNPLVLLHFGVTATIN